MSNTRKLRICVPWLSALLCSGTLAANHIVDVVWTPDGRFGHQAQIASGKFFEVCGKLTTGDKVRWTFTAAAPVDFNIHHHVGKEAVFHAKQSQVSAGGDTLNVTVPEVYCWMWTNKGSAPVSLTVQLGR